MKKILYISVIFSLLAATSCGDFGDTNIDPKTPTSAEPGYLFASATKALIDWKTSTSVNYNVMRLAAQYWSQVTYTNESRYDWEGRQISDQMWGELYARTLADLQEAKRLTEGEVEPMRANMNAQISVLEVYTWQLLVDSFGDIPYTEALNAFEDASPDYEDAATIYADLIERLDAAISGFDPSSTGFASGDLIYGGDIDNWIALANSLKMRIGIRLADVQPTTAQMLVTEGAAGAFTSNEQNAIMPYESEVATGNPMYNELVLSGRTDYVGSNTLVDIMNERSDPRLAYYLEPVGTEFIGLSYGDESSANFENYSNVNDMLKDPTFPGVLMTHSEVEFILAEAAVRGYPVAGTAEEHYNAGITASIMFWGGTEAEAAAYLAQPEVAFATAAGGNTLNAIAVQKWISFYNEADQGWIEWRRLDYPPFNAPENMNLEDIPLRYEYPTNESSINTSAYEAAVAKMGGDTKDIPVFWDVE